ncbi:MAG: HAD family hydrolase [Lachnospiraceae bacterium]|nr:HAD family hydrolase [Lachnospiraceae bacterium]MDE6252392.1 HAD family hydrolase [Lachnospiraceae bacterium]
MKYDTVIFDLDGTLLNTLDDLADSVNYALERCGFPRRTVEEVRCFVGNGIKLLIKRAVPEGTEEKQTEKVFEVFTTHYGENCRVKTRPYDGIMELLKNLKENDIKMAIVSNKVDFAVKELNNCFFKDYITVAVGECENVRRKPAPDSVNKALELLGSVRENSLYVGDSDVDIETAKNSGMDCVSVSWGFRDREFLKEKGADVIIDVPKELLGKLL